VDPEISLHATADAAGKVRVWAFTHVDHLLKYELPSIGGEVEDIVWDSEAKRILVVGAGAQKARVRVLGKQQLCDSSVPYALLMCSFLRGILEASWEKLCLTTRKT
jgi:hypothetical protein